MGATTEADYLDSFRRTGFTDVEPRGELDYFAVSTSKGHPQARGGVRRVAR